MESYKEIAKKLKMKNEIRFRGDGDGSFYLDKNGVTYRISDSMISNPHLPEVGSENGIDLIDIHVRDTSIYNTRMAYPKNIRSYRSYHITDDMLGKDILIKDVIRGKRKPRIAYMYAGYGKYISYSKRPSITSYWGDFEFGVCLRYEYA